MSSSEARVATAVDTQAFRTYIRGSCVMMLMNKFVRRASNTVRLEKPFYGLMIAANFSRR